MGRVARVIAACLLAAGAGGCANEERCPSFAHIVSGDFGRTGEMLWWTLQVEEIPAELTFNQPAVPANFLEYRWAVDLDTDRDGAVNLRLAIQHFAVSGAAPVTTANILSQTDTYILEVMGPAASSVGTFAASIADNTFRFDTTTSAAAGLANVTDRGQSAWRTSYRSGADLEDQCDEQWP
jgi:hypothetical protein